MKGIFNIAITIFLTVCVFTMLACNRENGYSERADEKLFMAIANDNLEMAKEAVSSGANINHFKNKRLRETLWHNEVESNPLLIAMMRNSDSIVDYLLECGADVNYVNKYGRTVLSYCSELRSKWVSKVIEKGADVNYIDKFGYTALDYSLQNKQLYSTKSFDILLKSLPVLRKSTIKLISDGLVSNPEYVKNYKILKTLADLYGDSIPKEFLDLINPECCTFYDKKKQDFNTDYIGVEISSAAAFKNSEYFCYLYENAPWSEKVSKEHLFRMAAMFGNVSNMKYLADNGVDINNRETEDYSALELAVMNNQIDSVKYILSLNPDMKISEKHKNENPMCYAIKNNNMEMVKMLMQYCLSENGGYYNIIHAVGAAIEECNDEALIYLLKNGAYPDSGYEVTNFLGKAVQSNNINAVNILMSQGADINKKVSFSPLYNAVVRGYTDIMKILFEYGAEINIDNGENIPVIGAIEYGQFDSLKLLTAHGANLQNVKAKNESILEFAQKCGSENIYNYLREHISE